MTTTTIEPAGGTQTASEGVGFLLQRQYTGVIAGAKVTAKDLIELLLRDFTMMAPASLAKFTRPPGKSGPLKVGDEMEVNIRMAGVSKVRVIEITPRSFTLLTMSEHPEAGRISFAARERDGGAFLDLRVRSRARSGSFYQLIGYLILGKAMQTKVWTEFVRSAATASGGRILKPVKVETYKVDEKIGDQGRLAGSTFDTFF